MHSIPKNIIEWLNKAEDSNDIFCIIASDRLSDELNKNGIEALTMEEFLPGFKFGSIN